MKSTSDLRRILAAGCVAGIVASCAPVAMDMMADAMIDAGESMMDAGGRLSDSGRQIHDAADSMTADAEAQPSCATNCTSSGILRVLTADTDPARFVRGSITDDALVTQDTSIRGPFVLTGFEVATSISPSSGRLYVVPEPDRCSDSGDLIAEEANQTVSTTSTSTVVREDGMSERWYVGPGEKLCVRCNGRCSWSGFHPYEDG